MKINMEKASYDGQWFDFGDGSLKIRPYPNSRQNVTIRDGGVILSGDSAFDMFSYCLTEWKAIIGADDQPLDLNPDVKKKIYDFRLGSVDGVVMSDFVLKTARELTVKMGDDTKN